MKKTKKMGLKKLNVIPTLILSGLGNRQRWKFLGLLLPLVFYCYFLSKLLNPAGNGQKCPAAFPVVGTHTCSKCGYYGEINTGLGCKLQ